MTEFEEVLSYDDDLYDSDDADEVELEEVEGREIGIDLGTTTSIIAYMEKGKAKTLKIKRKEIIPSAIYFETPDKLYFGQDAIKRGQTHPERLVTLFKRHMGTEQRDLTVRFTEATAQNNHSAKTYILDLALFLMPNSDQLFDFLHPEDKLIIPADYEKLLNDMGLFQPEQVKNALVSIAAYSERFETHPIDWDLLDKNDILSGSQRACFYLAVMLDDLSNSDYAILSDDSECRISAAERTIPFVLWSDIVTQNMGQHAEDEEGSLLKLNGTEASSHFLRYLREEAQKQLGTITKVVITVPANFSNVEVEATKKAAFNAGFSAVEIEREPNAAAIAYGFDQDGRDLNLLVYDFGGGTFDVSIIHSDGKNNFKVLATGGDAQLGGADITELIVEKLQTDLEEEYELSLWSQEDSGLPSLLYAKNMYTLHNIAENGKIELCDLDETDLELVNLYQTEEQLISYSCKFSKWEFEKLLLKHKILERINNVLDSTLHLSGIELNEIHDFIFAGGGSKTPLLKQKAEDYFHGREVKMAANVQTIIAEGAAILAAAIFNASETGINKKPIIHDQTNHDFGVATNGHFFDCIIPAGEALPTECERQYEPVKDEQDILQIECFQRNQGSKAKSTTEKGIEYLQGITIAGLPKMKKNELVIVVKFEMKKDYSLTVKVVLLDKQGQEIRDNNVQIKRHS